MTISDKDLKELKSCIYHDLAEMLRRTDNHYLDDVAEFRSELMDWAKAGGDPDLKEQA